MTAIPDEAVTAAVGAIHRASCEWDLSECLQGGTHDTAAKDALEAGAPLIVAAERERLGSELDVIRDQAKRYMEARFGDSVWFRAPETFANVLERWIWAVASSCAPQTGEESIKAIEEHLAGGEVL